MHTHLPLPASPRLKLAFNQYHLDRTPLPHCTGSLVVLFTIQAFTALMADPRTAATMADGALRRTQRRLMQPAFSNDALNGCVRVGGEGFPGA
jgi:hypothetical protein